MRAADIAAGALLLLILGGGVSFAMHETDIPWRGVAAIWAISLGGTAVMVLACVLLAGGWS